MSEAWAITSREIGVRVALGADAASVTRLVVGGRLKLAALGIGLGSWLRWGVLACSLTCYMM